LPTAALIDTKIQYNVLLVSFMALFTAKAVKQPL